MMSHVVQRYLQMTPSSSRVKFPWELSTTPGLPKWFQKWQMEFNEDKCDVLHQILTGSNNRREGLRCLRFRMHVPKAMNKPSVMLGLVRATFTCIDETTLPRLFTTMVCPHLEYRNVILCPRFRRDKLEVEQIQKRPTIKADTKLERSAV